MSARHGVTSTTINLWARQGRVQKHRYDNLRRCLYEPLDMHAILTRRSADELQLKTGDTVTAIIKSTEVMIQKD